MRPARRYSKKEVLILFDLFKECAAPSHCHTTPHRHAATPPRATAPPRRRAAGTFIGATAAATAAVAAAAATRTHASAARGLHRYDEDGSGNLSISEFKQHFKKRNEESARAHHPATARSRARPRRPLRTPPTPLPLPASLRHTNALR